MRVLFTDLDLAAKFVKPVSSTMAKEFKWTIAKKNQEEREARDLIMKLKATIE